MTFEVKGRGEYRNKYMSVFPNWYVWHNDSSEARVLISTQSTDLSFVSGFDTDADKRHSGFTYWTPKHRYVLNKMGDWGRAPRMVIPTPLEVDMAHEPDGFTITPDFQLVCSAELANEGNYLKGKKDALDFLSIHLMVIDIYILFLFGIIAYISGLVCNFMV